MQSAPCPQFCGCGQTHGTVLIDDVSERCPHILPEYAEYEAVGAAVSMAVATENAPDIGMAVERIVRVGREIVPDSALSEICDCMMPMVFVDAAVILEISGQAPITRSVSEVAGHPVCVTRRHRRRRCPCLLLVLQRRTTCGPLGQPSRSRCGPWPPSDPTPAMRVSIRRSRYARLPRASPASASPTQC